MSDLLKTFVQGIFEAQQIVHRHTVIVECSPSTTTPGLAAYTLTGHSRADVQACIDARMREAEDAPNGGWAQFLHPWLAADGKWKSRGEVMRYPAEAAA